MKKTLVWPLLAGMCACSSLSLAMPGTITDTVRKHQTDGMLSEWNTESMEIHKETGIQYAVSNDAGKLYIGMRIVNPRTQVKMIVNGMYLFIDIKGKKREGTRVEFPIHKEGPEAMRLMPRSAPGEAPAPESMRLFREQMINGMMLLRCKGLEGQEQDEQYQTIDLPNNVNIAFGWDEAGTMDIEYEIPFPMVGLHKEPAAGKIISLGIQLNGMQLSGGGAPSLSSTSSQIVSVPAGSGGGRGGTNFNTSRTGSAGATGRGAVGGDRPVNNDPFFREQSFWIKHTMQ
ncbi:MAG: hypothetical protein GXC72_06455 [Chitinophagaceae bacterium]|nr:hypothetical protein [Chitinophagaceae bacterium]